MTQKIALLIAMCSVTLNAFSWGQKGHDVTAYIAEQHLTPTTKQALDSILENKSIVYWANWLDNASHTPEFAYSKTWHYKNIDDGVAYESAPKNPKGDVVTAINGQIEALRSGKLTKEESALALKMLVHLVGDVHQPMHVGHATDLGGNRVKVRYFGKDNNLHSVWDSSLVESAHKWSYTEWQNQIDRLKPEAIAEITMGTPDDWCKETFVICGDVYAKTPEGTNISYDYIADWTPVIENQILKGGLRLAKVLNQLFDVQP